VAAAVPVPVFTVLVTPELAVLVVPAVVVGPAAVVTGGATAAVGTEPTVVTPLNDEA
jgi:hypothetical protein